MVKPLVPPAVDVLGPYMTTPQAVNSRPGRIGDAAGAGFSWCKDCTDDNAEDGTPITAEHLNNYKAQFVTLFQSSGIDINDTDEMATKAIRSGWLNFFPAPGGTANAIEIAPEPSFATLAELKGTSFVVLTGAAANSGAMTFKVNALTGDLTWPDGTAFRDSDVPPFTLLSARHDGTAFRATLALSPTQVRKATAQRNLLVNGDFQINQRTFAGGALANGVYGYDRWKASGASSMTLAGYVLTLASGEVQQLVEPGLWGVADFASTLFTLSVDNPSANLTVTIGSTAGTITAGSGRRSVTLTTAAGDTGNLSVKLKRTTAGSVTFGRVKLELGFVATPWQARSSWDERVLAYRYFWRFTAPYTDARFAQGLLADTGNFSINIELPVEMRSAPTVSMTASGWNRRVGTTGLLTSISSYALHRHTLAIEFTSAALTPGTFYPASLSSVNAGSLLTVDAEI